MQLSSLRSLLAAVTPAVLVATTLPVFAEGAASQLTPEEETAGWKLLFDGRTTNGWRAFKSDTFPNKGWVIEGGCLRHLKGGGGGDLLTVEKFDEFELVWEWKVGAGANSGLKYFVRETADKAIGHEYQMLDAARVDESPDGKGKIAGFYDVLAPGPVTVKPLAEFNQSRILVKGTHVEHWINGAKVLEYELDSPALRDAVAHSKFRTVAGFGTRVAGPLLLQDHGGEVSFRNIKIRNLAGR